jgi:hypothetical protein
LRAVTKLIGTDSAPGRKKLLNRKVQDLRAVTKLIGTDSAPGRKLNSFRVKVYGRSTGNLVTISLQKYILCETACDQAIRTLSIS